MPAPQSLHALHARMGRHLGLTAAGVLALVAGFGAISARVELDQDVAALLPGGPGSPREAAKLLSEFGALDTLLLNLEVPGATPDELADEGARLAKRLRESGRFAEVYEGPTAADLVLLGQVLLPRRLLLIDDPAGEIDRRLAPARLAASLDRLKGQLASPQALGLKAQMLADPLGLDEGLLAGLAKSGGDVEYHKAHLLSKDRRHLLLVATPLQGALAVNASQEMLDWVAAEAKTLRPGPQGPARLIASGGPRFAAESARLVRSDVISNFLTSGAALLVIFLWRFRSLRLLALTSVPLGLGVLAGLATVALVQGRIHGLSLGFGAALIGIAVDYPLHLLNRALAEPGESAQARLAVALDDVWSSLWLGWGTSALAFLALFLSRFPGLRELALFAAAGVTAAFAATLVLLPPLCTRLTAPRAVSGAWSGRLTRFALPTGPAVVVALALVGLSGWFARSLRFDGDLRNLDAQKPETLEQHRQVMERFGQNGGSSLAVVSGATAEEALTKNDAVAQALGALQHKAQVSGVKGLAAVLPSASVQAARTRSLAAMDLPGAKARLAAGAEAAGFSATAFDGFWAGVEAAAAGQVAPLTPELLAPTSLGPIVSRALRCTPQGCRAVTAFERNPSTSMAQLSLVLPQGTQVVDGASLAADTVAQIPEQLLLLCGLGLLANLVMLGVAYRSLKSAVVATLPCVLGLVGTVGVLAATGTPLNLVSASALVLVLGCGVDYGIFVLHGVEGTKAPSGVEAMGVFLASSTTIAGFGTLAMASHKSLQSLGVAVGLGIVGSAAAALLLLPGLYRALFPSRAVAAVQEERL